MKKKTLRTVLAVLCIGALMCLFVGTGLADAGGFSGESDFDFSDSGSDWGSSYDDSWDDDDWDWGSDDDDSDWDNDDWDSGSTFGSGPIFIGGGSGSSSGGSADLSETIIFFVVVVAIVIFFNMKRQKAKHRPAPARRSGSVAAPNPLRPMSEYRALDEGFDEAAFCEKVSNAYVRLQNAWTAQDLEPVRVLLSETMMAQFERQLNALKARGQVNYVDRIAVLDVRLSGFEQQGDMDQIHAMLRTRIVDYTLDAQGGLVSGDRTKEKFMMYEWTLERPSGQTTSADSGVTRVTCPSCGAPLEINASGKCPYCGSIVRVEEHDFVLCRVRGISQKTV